MVDQEIKKTGGKLPSHPEDGTDTDEQKQSAKALAESRAQILALFDSTSDFIGSVDPETLVSSRSTGLHGLLFESICGLSQLAIFRTQLFNPKEMPNVVKVQSGCKAQPLSAYCTSPMVAVGSRRSLPRPDS